MRSLFLEEVSDLSDISLMKKDLECQCTDIHGMIFYTKLKELKNLSRRSCLRPSFSLIELIIVIIILGILAYSLTFKFFDNSLQLASDSLISNIRFAKSLAFKEDKYQPFPLHQCDGSDEGKVECNRSKYWFKQWWQIKFFTFKDDEGITHYWYEVFTDLPSSSQYDNFDKVAKDPKNERNVSIALNPINNKLMIGHCDETGTNFPKCDKIDKELDLTESFNIKKVEFSENFDRSKRIMFDNFGNVFLKESISTTDRNGDVGDINPLDYNARRLLTKLAYIRLCTKINSDNKCLLNKNSCVQINITPTGYIYKTNCE